MRPSRYRQAGRTWPRQGPGRTTPPAAGDLYSHAPHVDIELVSKRLKERRKFDAAARALGKGARRFNVAPAVEGCLRCLSANHAGWRSENPLPELDDHPHGGPGADLLELARQRRQASVGRAPGSL